VNGRAEGATVLVTTHMWIWWAEIAIDHEAEARSARESAAAGRPLGLALSAETRAAMVAMSASAHALDAVYGAVKARLPAAREGDTRWSNVLEMLKRGFEIRGDAGGGRWAREFEWLFDVRDAAVHFKESQNPTEPHPLGTRTGRENVTYSLEPAERAVLLMFEVLDVCTSSPRDSHPTIVEWATAMHPVIDQLKTRRAGAQTGAQ
jgi:hypothetical protein